ncbi:MAG: four helix bundle protein [Flavobacteriales bacterium]
MNTDFNSLSLGFGKRITKVYLELTEKRREYNIAKQLLRSGTAVGALYREATYAESKADLIHKLHGAIKECSETVYWIDLLEHMGKLNQTEHAILRGDEVSLLKILTAMIKTAKRNKENG